MERGKEGVIPLDEKTMEKIGKQILNRCDFKSIELQERIDKALDYIKKIYNSNTETVENSKGECIDVGYAVPALEDIKKILKGDK